jgi:tetratricopeptide (TPR) repeat protein
LQNDEETAIQEFKAAIAQDPADTRAHLGLTYAYGLRLDDKASWNAYRQVLETTSDPKPYIYASQLARRFSSNLYRPESGIQTILRDAIDSPDSMGILRAMAYELLGNMEERAGHVEEGRRLYALIGSIDSWRLIGPFDNVSGSGHDKKFPPEREDVPNAVYEGSDQGKVWWITPPNGRNDGWVDFARHFPTVYGVFYARTYVKSETERRVQLRLGTSGAFRLYLNDELVADTVEEHNNDLDTYITAVTLQRGWNSILVKCDNSKLDRCNFLLRITDEVGIASSDLVFSSEPHPFSKSQAKPVVVPNPFIAYFQQQIQEHPDRLENSLLLVEAYLRNDEVERAEEVIRGALKQHPDFIPALMLALDAYQRSDRTDETVSTIEHITSLRPDLPISLVYSFVRASATEQLDTAEVILEQIKNLVPESTDYYDAAITLARARNEPAKVVELQAAAFALHREVIGYANAAAVMATRSEGGYDAALKIVDQHLGVNYAETGLLLKAGILEDALRYDEWEKTYNELFELSPAAPGYHSRKSESYARRKKWDLALRSIQQAIADAPTVTWLWYRSGTYKKTLKDMQGARADFLKAIDTDPANFDARESLRELDGTPSPFSVMPVNNIDSMMKAAPTPSELSDEHSITLLYDIQRVVHDGSRCEMRYEYLVRVLTKDGIDRYKELNLPGGSGDLTVEKAVVIKPNGREIPSDQNGGYAVFKNLEPGDFIYLRTRSREHSRGSLSGYFMDDFWMDDNVPVKIARYSLLTKPGTTFNWVFNNGAINPVTTTTSFGELTQWELKDIPPIEPEEDMPEYRDIAKVLQITSVPRWQEVVMWYYDIARTKTRTSIDVREEMKRLFPADGEYSDSDVVAGVYRFITNDIRYSNVPFRQSGIVPQEARDVLVTRIGDCKDVATLCISMLAERGIPAYHVLVKTNTSLIAREPLPSIPFDHAIVMGEVDGKNLFMDLTADNVPLNSVPFADLNALCLLIRPGEIAPFRLSREFFTPNVMKVHTNIQLNADLSAHIVQHFTHEGARTQFYRGSWKGANKADLERWLKEGLSNDLADVNLLDYDIKYLDTLLPTLEYTLTYDVPDYTMEAADLMIVRLPWYAPFEPVSALSYEQRTHPYEYTKYMDTLSETVELTLPTGYEPLGIKARESFDHDAARVLRSIKQENRKVSVARTAVFLRTVVATDEYQSYKTFYNNVSRSDRQALLLVPKGTVIKAPKQPPASSPKKR